MTDLEITANTVEDKFIAAVETMLRTIKPGEIREDYLVVAAQLAPIAATLRAIADRRAA